VIRVSPPRSASLPERCANVWFEGLKRNPLFIAARASPSTHSTSIREVLRAAEKRRRLLARHFGHVEGPDLITRKKEHLAGLASR
jgi:hypothetical protein